MSNLKALLLNVKQNLPPLKRQSNETKPKEIVLNDKKPNALIQQYLINRQKSLNNEKYKKDSSAHNWQKIREKMLIEMEQKRDMEWEQNQIAKRLENEETDELVPNVDDNTDDNDDDYEEDDDSEEIDREVVEVSDDEHREPIDDKHSENSNNLSENEDDSDDDQILSNFKPKKSLPMIDDDEENNDEDEDGIDDIDINQTGIFGRQDDNDYEQMSISQNFTLASIEPDATNTDTQNNYDSQMLLELCSGRFNNDDQKDANEIEEMNSDGEKNSENEQDTQTNNDDDEDSDTEETIIRKKPKTFKIKDFLEDEAELSDDDDGHNISSDESDDEEDQELIENLIDDDDHGLKNDELREQVEKIHNKNMLDEDKRQMMILKEYFFEDGDLFDGHNRQKKFRWKMNDTDNELFDFVNNLHDSDSDDDDSFSEGEEDDNDKHNMIKLKRTFEEVSKDDNAVDDEDSDRIKKIRLNSMKLIAIKKNQSSLKSFVIRDERFKQVSKINDDQNKTKRTKVNNNSVTSIFDVL